MINSAINPRDDGWGGQKSRAGGEPAPRFIVSPDDVSAGLVHVRGAEGHHARNVLRLDKGDEFIALDGRGAEHEAVVRMRTADGVIGRITRTTRRSREPVAQVTLALPLVRAAKLASIVARATAVGARAFTVFECARTPKQNLTASEVKHLNAVAAAAAKQSLRSVVPHIQGPVSFGEMLKEARRHDLALLCRPQPGAEPLPALLAARKTQALTFLIAAGPEGGLTPEEEEGADAAAFHPLDLGPRRLRTEDAATTACALVLFASGDLGPFGPGRPGE